MNEKKCSGDGAMQQAYAHIQGQSENKNKAQISYGNVVQKEISYALSPRILLANWMSLGMMVTRLAWMAHRLVSSKRPTK